MTNQPDIRNRITEIRKMRLGEIAQGPVNWRRHPDSQVAAFMGLIREVGWFGVPLVYWSEKAGGWAYLDGNMRGERLPDFEADVAVTDFTDADIALPLAGFDPISAMATADREALGALLQSVQSSDAAVQEMLSGLAEREGVFFGGNGKEQEPPEPQIDRAEELQAKWQVSSGDVWQAGEHYVICGDCAEVAATQSLSDLLFIDPPYGVKRDKGFEGFGGFGPPIARRQYEDNWDAERPTKQTMEALRATAKNALIFGGNYLADILPKSTHWIVWDKLNTMPTFGDCELIWTSFKRLSVKKVTFEYNGLIGKEAERFHPTQKPLGLCELLLKEYSKEGQAVIDYYLGSGTTLIACERLGRLGRGVEIEPKYVSVCLERLSQMNLVPKRVKE